MNTNNKQSFTIEKVTPANIFPRLSLFMGKPKIGKSTAMSKLPDALILAVDPSGYEEIETNALVKADNLKVITEVIFYFFSVENTTYKRLVIDELRSLSELFAKQIKAEAEVKRMSEINYNKGNFDLKEDLYNFLVFLKKNLTRDNTKSIVLVAHSIETNDQIKLDINGKNENMILSLVDSIGYISRDEDKLNVDFKIKSGVEYGARNKGLAGYTGELNWPQLFKIAEGK